MIETLFLAIGIALTPISNTIIEDNEIEQPEEPIIMPDFDESSSFSDAISINTNNALIGTFTDSSDIDYYSFTASSNLYNLYTNGYSNVNVSIYTSNLTLLATLNSVSNTKQLPISSLSINSTYYLVVSAATLDYTRRYSIGFTSCINTNFTNLESYTISNNMSSSKSCILYSMTMDESYYYQVKSSYGNNIFNIKYFESDNLNSPCQTIENITSYDYKYVFLRKNVTYYFLIYSSSFTSSSSFSLLFTKPSNDTLEHLICHTNISNPTNYYYSIEYHSYNYSSDQITPAYNPYPDETTSFSGYMGAGDDRKKVINTKAYPFNAIGLNMVDNNSIYNGADGGGSGFAVAENAYITAAHVLTEYNGTTNEVGLGKHRQFAPGLNCIGSNISTQAQFGVFKVLEYYFPLKYLFTKNNSITEVHMSNYDWGVCVFDTENPLVEPIYQHGFFSIKYIKNKINVPYYLYSSGYPGVEGENNSTRTYYQWTNVNDDGTQKYSSNSFYSSNNLLCTTLRLSNGNSGQPVYSIDSNNVAIAYGPVVGQNYDDNMFSCLFTAVSFGIVQCIIGGN